MDVFIIIKLFFCVCVVFLLTKSSDANNSFSCGFLSPEIRFPFRIRGLEQHQCSHPDFNLFCRENRTMIHFPTYGDLVVKSISYDTRKLSLLDPKNCVHEVFLNLNLSLTPFSYYYVVEKYKYINCSDKIIGSFEQVPCLSGSNHHVYVVKSSFPVPVSCSCVKTVEIPFSYSRYLSDSSFGLGLTWDSIGFNDERPEKYFKVSGIIVFVFMVGMVLYAILSNYHKKLNEEKVKATLDEVEIDKLLGEYEVLNITRDTPTNVKVVSS